MASDTDKFHVWLCDRLKSLDLDEEVLGEYIAGILDSDDSNEEEKVGILTDILEGMMETPVIDVCSGIVMKWKEYEAEKIHKGKEEESQKQDALAAIMEKQARITKVENLKPHSRRVDVDIKKHVIAQYEQQSDDEDIESDSEPEESCQAEKPRPLEMDKRVFQNINASSVVNKEKEKREKQRLENDEKKLKIKQDREKQKEKIELRKDKEKKRTQKGERLKKR